MAAHQAPPSWDSPGKNTGVGCHFLLQCMKVKSESEVAQSCPTLSDPMDCNLPGSSIHGIFQARVLEWGAIAFFKISWITCKKSWFPLVWAHTLCCCCSVTKSYPTLCDPMDCSTPGFPVLHHLRILQLKGCLIRKSLVAHLWLFIFGFWFLKLKKF